ncbi:MAG: glycosyltransferase family 4 protein [Acidobacteriota bacterium]
MPSPSMTLVVTPSFRGGSWRRIEEILLRSRGTRFLAVGYGDGGSLPSPHRILRMPFGDYSRWHFLVRAPFVAVLVSLPLALCALALIVARRPPRVLANGLVLSFLLLPACKLWGSRLVVVHHGWTSEVRGAAAWLTRYLSRHLDRVFVNSRGSREDLSRLVDRRRLQVIEHNAPELFFEPQEPLAECEGVPLGDRPVVLYVGRLDPEKNVDLMVQVLGRTLEAGSSALFVVCGDGALRPEVEDLARRWPRQVLYLGYVEDQRRLARLYRSARVLWGCGTPTYLELPAVESLVVGTPVLIPDRPSILGLRRTRDEAIDPALVPEFVGRLVPPTVPSLETALWRILRGEDTFDRATVAAHGRRHYGLGNLDPVLDAVAGRTSVDAAS